MGMFSRDRKADRAPQRDVIEAIHEDLEQQARDMLPEVAKVQPEWLAEYQRWHDEDVSGYDFRCERHGDMLALFITRHKGTDEEQKVVNAVNLGKTNGLVLREGGAPDMRGTRDFDFGAQDASGEWLRRLTSSDGNFEVENGGRWVVRPLEMGRQWREREIVVAPTHSNKGAAQVFVQRNYHSIYTRAEGTARPARDDRIEFTGADTILNVPAGLGVKVYTAILAECARAYDWATAASMNSGDT